jgi:hypothetical protein
VAEKLWGVKCTCCGKRWAGVDARNAHVRLEHPAHVLTLEYPEMMGPRFDPRLNTWGVPG